MQFKKSELLDAIKIVMTAIGTREDDSKIYFQSNWIKTFNDTNSVYCPFDSNINIATKADEIFKFITKVKSDLIDINVEEDIFRLKSGRSELGLAAYQNEFPIEEEDLNWKSIPEDFIEGLNLCKFSVGKDISYGPLANICVDNNEIISSDNIRASIFTMKNSIDRKILLPISTVNELIKNTAFTDYAITESQIYFKNVKNIIFGSRLVLGDYPSERIKNIFDELDDSDKYTFPSDLRDAVDISSLMSFSDMAKNDFINISIKDGKLVCRGERIYGYSKEEIDITTNLPETLDINILYKFFMEILSYTNDFYLNDNILLFSFNNYKHLLTTVITQ